MEEIYQFGDVHCLTRYTPQIVFDSARALLKKVDSQAAASRPGQQVLMLTENRSFLDTRR